MPRTELEPILELASYRPNELTFTVRLRQPPVGDGRLEVDSAASRCIAALMGLLHDAGIDRSEITRTRIRATEPAHFSALSAARDRALGPTRAIHATVLGDEASAGELMAEIDARLPRHRRLWLTVDALDPPTRPAPDRSRRLHAAFDSPVM